MNLPPSLITDMLYMQPSLWVKLEEEESYTWWQTPSGAEICVYFAPTFFDDVECFPFRLSWRPPFAQRLPLHAHHFADIPMVGPDQLSSIHISCDAALQERTQGVIKRLQKMLIEKGETNDLWYVENGEVCSFPRVLKSSDLPPDLFADLQFVEKTCAVYMPHTTNVHETFLTFDRVVVQLPKTLHARLDLLQA